VKDTGRKPQHKENTMTIQQQITELANQLGISDNDVRNFITPIVDSMHNDGVTPDMVEADSDWVEAYMIAEGKKIESFQTTYITNPAARSAFQAKVFESLS